VTEIDLDQPEPRRESRRSAALPVVLAVVGLLVGIVVGAVASDASTAGQRRPTITARAQWLPGSAFVPTATAWYADGGRANLKLAVAWVADRPVRLVTVVAEVSCGIEVDGLLVAADQALASRYAVCAWAA
jgi:hypothetical protein